jgi:hypothetical protein
MYTPFGPLEFGRPGQRSAVKGVHMASVRERAQAVTETILRGLRVNLDDADLEAVSTIIEQALADAAQDQERKDLKRIADVQASAHAHLSRLLNASPAVDLLPCGQRRL